MDTILSILHVVTAVFLVGPMAILPMTALRAIRAGHSSQAATLAKATSLLTYLSLTVVVFGFGVLGMADPQYELSITTGWVMASLILYVIAFALSLTVVVPGLRKAAKFLAADTHGASYPAVAAGSGLVSLLLLAVVILMVWKP